MDKNIKYLDYDIVNSTRKNTKINYNKKNGLSFILWKNKTYSDKIINYQIFLKSFNINSYFNLIKI
jgi:hypothetical protein